MLLFNKSFFINKLSSTIKESRNKLFLFYCIYIVLISLCSIIYGYFLNQNYPIFDEDLNIIFKNIPFSNGDLIYNLYFNNKYFTKINEITFFLQKTPFVPYLIYFISQLSTNFYFIIVCKNIIIFSFYFLIVYEALKVTNKNVLFFLIILFIPLMLPYNFGVALNFFYEDSIIAILLPSAFLILLTNNKIKYLYLGIIFFSLYFVKTTMFFIVLIIPFLIILMEKKSYFKFVPLLFSFLAILIWGLYGFNKTGKFPILSTGSSINSYVMSYAMNNNFYKYYPNKSTDLIPNQNINIKDVKNEWEFYEFYKKKNMEYLKNNRERYFKDIIIKAKFILFGINRDGALPDENENFDNSIRVSQLLSKFFLNVAIIILILLLFKSIFEKNIKKKEIFYFIILLFNILPHLAVWATSKHLIGIINVSLVYIIFTLSDFIKFKY